MQARRKVLHVKKMKDSISGWILFQNLDTVSDEKIVLRNNVYLIDNGLHKFDKDGFLKKTGDKTSFLEGYVFNKQELIKKNHCLNWKEILEKVYCKKEILNDFRGGFSGFVIAGTQLFAFNDQIGNKALYYYANGNNIAISSRWNIVMDILKTNNIARTFNEQAAQYMLTYGYMLDNNTFEKQIHRLLPGEYLEIDMTNGAVVVKRYFLLDNVPRKEISEKDSIDIVDFYFRQAVKREFDKDIEYGYKHLVDLSGGLDSRMTTWVAHELGYCDQINITYSQSNYLDVRIAQKIASYLGHEFLFKSLDDFKWYMDIDEIVAKNNGAALYSGISGGRRFLEQIDTRLFGIEHTGMIGDAIVSTFFNDTVYNFSKPQTDKLRYSNKLHYDIPENILHTYDNMEQFSIYTRGFLGAQTSYFIRQDYVETSSPFLDMDFLENVFQVPFKYRLNCNIYLKWIKEKYPSATQFGWEKWGGIRPRRAEEWKKYVIYGYRRFIEELQKTGLVADKNNMTPFDFYLQANGEVRQYINEYYAQYIHHEVIPEYLQKDMTYLFETGTASEKAQVLTVLGIIKNYYV